MFAKTFIFLVPSPQKKGSARREHSPLKWLDSKRKKKLGGDLHGCLQTRSPTGLVPAPGLPAEALPWPWQQRVEIPLGFVLRFLVGSGDGKMPVEVLCMRKHPACEPPAKQHLKAASRLHCRLALV